MSDVQKRLTFKVIGPFSVQTEDGTDVTPVGMKNQALLALLLLSPGMARTRRWTEDKLWSLFGPDQAGANLRQSLAKIRKTSPRLAEVLISDRSGIKLNTKALRVDLHDDALPTTEGYELLEGIDVRDPEFEDWLRTERTQFQRRIEASKPRDAVGLNLQCVTRIHGSSASELIGDILANQIGQSVSEQVRAWRNTGEPSETTAQDQNDIEIQCNLIDSGNSANVYLKVSHLPTGRILHSRIHELKNPGDVLTSAEPIAAMVFDVADRITSKIPLVVDAARPEARATALSRLALYRMFSFEPAALREADELLKQAYECDPNALYPGWRGMVRMIQLIELHSDNPQACREEAAELSHIALENCLDNSLVQALVSQVRIMGLKDAVGGLEIAEQAVAQNPSNGFAWNALAIANMRAGCPEEALKHSTLAGRIARFSPFRQWWEVNHCVVNIACNRPEHAIIAGESAARAAPSLRPAHRHLLALYAMQGDFDKAVETAGKLEKIEPGFSLDRFVNDDLYPVRTLRTLGMLTSVRELL